MEEWAVIDGFPDYEISSYGRVYSHKRHIMLKPYPDEWGYLRVCLRNKIRHQESIHRLVAKAFIPNPFNKPEINHIDGDRLNNAVDNLEWCTRSENEQHAFRTGLNNRSSYDAGKPKMPVRIIETGEIFESINECARKIGVTRASVLACIHGRWRTCKGYHIEILNY